MADQAKPQRKTLGCGGAIAIIFGIFIVLMVFASKDVEKDKAETAVKVASGPAMAVTPEELRAAYDANEAAAQQNYGGQVLEVSGKIDKITLDIGDDPVIQLATAKPYDTVHASLAESANGAAAGLAKGQKIVLRCADVSEVIGTPMLKDCIVG